MNATIELKKIQKEIAKAEFATEAARLAYIENVTNLERLYIERVCFEKMIVAENQIKLEKSRRPKAG